MRKEEYPWESGGMANFAMADLNNDIWDFNVLAGIVTAFAEGFGIDVTPDELEAITSGMDIEGYPGMNITDMLALGLIAGYSYSRQSSGGRYATDGTWEQTVNLRLKTSCYFGGVEPVINFGLGEAIVSLGASLLFSDFQL